VVRTSQKSSRTIHRNEVAQDLLLLLLLLLLPLTG
jgi:hypothetical protein